MKVGVVSDGGGDRASLRRALEELGHLIIFDADPHELSGQHCDDIDLLIALEPCGIPKQFAGDCFQLMISADDLNPPRIAFEAWKQHLRHRIARVRRPLGASGSASRAEYVWLLAASAGGPATVTRFLSAVPRAAGVALLYAQHIEAAHLDQLSRWISRESDWRVHIAATTDFLLEGSLTLIHPQRRFRLRPDGEMRVLSGTWPKPYRPNIDLIAENLAATYREKAGMIVFSGLGDDGALGSQHVHEQGGEVWVQAPSNCIASAMPEAVIGQGSISYVGDLDSLARRFQHRHRDAAAQVIAAAGLSFSR